MLRKRLVLRYRGISSCIAFGQAPVGYRIWPGSRWVRRSARAPLHTESCQARRSAGAPSGIPFAQNPVGRAVRQEPRWARLFF